MNTEERLTRVEVKIDHIESDITQIKTDLRDMRSDFRWLFGIIITAFSTLTTLMAHGFKWF